MTDDQYATQEYNLLVSDMFDYLPMAVVSSPNGQAVINYFELRIKKWMKECHEREAKLWKGHAKPR